ncbi:MAG TPA: hypothetical protein VMT88_12585, partial [Actinomycetes bacterium]|nr:hypothetical protein [Actinomycetes bacterium]
MFEHSMDTPGCTGTLLAADPRQLSDVQLRDGVVEWEKTVGFAQASQFGFMAEMARREEASWV